MADASAALLIALAFGPSGFAATRTSAPSPTPSPTPVALSLEYRDDLSRVVPLRQRLPIQVTNSRGDITVIGWSQDKIRVHARRSTRSADPAEARRLLQAADFAVRTSEGRTEVIAEYGAGLSLEERLRERANPRTSMELTIYAPADLDLRVWAVDGKVVLKDWRSSVEVRTNSGPLTVIGVRGENISLLCPKCSMTLETVRGSIRCMGGEGLITLRDVSGPQIYTESLNGPVNASRVEGDQLYVSKTGAVRVEDSRGRIEFNLQQGAFELINGSGFLSGKTTTGRVTAQMRDWAFADKALIETVSGDVFLSLPRALSADLDLWSRDGRVNSEFPIQRATVMKPETSVLAIGGLFKKSEKNSTPVLQSTIGNRQSGAVGAGGEILRVYSEKGSIFLKTTAL